MMQEPLMCAIARRGMGPVPAHPKNISHHKGSVSRKLVFTHGGNPDSPGNPDMQAVGESGVEEQPRQLQEAPSRGGGTPHRGLDTQGGAGSQAGM